MNNAGVQAFENALAEKLRAIRIESKVLEGMGSPEIGDMLRVLLPLSNSEVAITDFTVFSLEANNDLLQLYTTVVVEIGDNYDTLVKRLVQWNASCSLGHFGIVERDRQLYHRYTIPVETNSDPEALADRALLLLSLVREVVVRQYAEAKTFARG